MNILLLSGRYFSYSVIINIFIIIVFFGGDDVRYNKTYGSLQPDGQELGGSISVSIIVKNMQVCLLHTIYMSIYISVYI